VTPIPRKTLFLAILLALVLIGVTISAFRPASHAGSEVQTHVLHTMVATMHSVLQRAGLVPASVATGLTRSAWPLIAWLVVLGVAAVWIVRTREPERQQHSRSRRS